MTVCSSNSCASYWKLSFCQEKNKNFSLYRHDSIAQQCKMLLQSSTRSIPNYKSFNFLNIKFDHSSYSKFCTKYYFFLLCIDLLIKVLQKWLKFNYICTNFLNKTDGQTEWRESKHGWGIEPAKPKLVNGQNSGNTIEDSWGGAVSA
jgi:hypothetical protein